MQQGKKEVGAFTLACVQKILGSWYREQMWNVQMLEEKRRHEFKGLRILDHKNKIKHIFVPVREK